jgi:imidazolonepropionase-like amidohydrolase
MTRHRDRFLDQLSIMLVGILVLAGSATESEEVQITSGLKAFTGARIIDGTGQAPIEQGVIIVRDGEIEAVGTKDAVAVPAEAARIDATGKTIIPGLINTHGHVAPSSYTKANVLGQLGLYARYGVTTVVSLGGDGPVGIQLRDQQDTSDLDRARLYAAGPVVTAQTPEEARARVNELADMNVDMVKIRVDDNLGTASKMPEAVYRAVIDRAHDRGLRLVAHVYYLEDAKSLLRAGADFVAHSIRDQEVDDELIGLLKGRDICACPTLMREVSTFVYETRPAFFDDPFFLREADPGLLAELEDPEAQEAMRNSRSAQQYKVGLEVAKRNVKKLGDAGVRVSFGTDTGPRARFQGYFEQLELEQMVDAGLEPMQALVAATRDAADCMHLDRLGTLEPGNWADLIILNANPLEDIRNTREIDSVWIAGNRVRASSS